MARRSHLYSYHKEHGKLTEFSGFDMPLWYSGIIEEHNAVRNAAGLFDVSHMGRFSIIGKESTKFLNHLLPTDAWKVKSGRAFYSTICNDQAGIIDDVVVNKINEDDYLMVVNAGNREKDWNWVKEKSNSFSTELHDLSNSIALIAFQGPLAQPILQTVTEIDLSLIKRFGLAYSTVLGTKCLISRTGYTGEDGFELSVLETPLEQPDRSLDIWNHLLSIGKEQGVLPCGLGARDSLRLEAGMCLHGNDIDETTTPVEAAIDFVVAREKQDNYPGREVIESQLKNGVQRKRVAFSMQTGGIPRHGYEIKLSGAKIGLVTSGSFSPTIKNGIGMGYVPSLVSEKGQTLGIQIRADEQVASVVDTPFYDTTRYGFKRKLQA